MDLNRPNLSNRPLQQCDPIMTPYTIYPSTSEIGLLCNERTRLYWTRTTENNISYSYMLCKGMKTQQKISSVSHLPTSQAKASLMMQRQSRGTLSWRDLTVIRLRLCIFWEITSLRHNIFSSIKVMKVRLSKKDEEEQEDE